MHFKKRLAGFLSVTVLSLSAVTAFAANTEDFKAINYVGLGNGVMPVNAASDKAEQPNYKSFTGTVKEITDFKGKEGSKFVMVENEEGGAANIIISGDTYVLNSAEITVGSVITGFYDANLPMIMIYPPQYKAVVVAVVDKNSNVKVDRFDKDLISSDNSLKLNISDKTEIILQDGKAFDGELTNRTLVVTYGISTKSIPAQTTPTKIVVLFEKAVPPIYNLTEEEKAALIGDVSAMDIIVNNKKIEAPAAYTNEQGTVMVPLRAISEALEFDVNWDSALQSVMIGKGISLTVGKDYYTYMKTAPIQLGAAPELVNGRTFVPLSFFKKVVHMNNAYVFEAQIVVDNGEIMQ